MQLGIEATRADSDAAIWTDVQSIVTGVASAGALGLAWAARAGPTIMMAHAIGMMGVIAGDWSVEPQSAGLAAFGYEPAKAATFIMGG